MVRSSVQSSPFLRLKATRVGGSGTYKGPGSCPAALLQIDLLQAPGHVGEDEGRDGALLSAQYRHHLTH